MTTHPAPEPGLDHDRRREIERLAASLPPGTLTRATTLSVLVADPSTDVVCKAIAELVAPILAAEKRRAAWAMVKGYDPTGSHYRPVVRCATQLFDAAHRLDGQRADNEPDEYAEPEYQSAPLVVGPTTRTGYEDASVFSSLVPPTPPPWARFGDPLACQHCGVSLHEPGAHDPDCPERPTDEDETDTDEDTD